MMIVMLVLVVNLQYCECYKRKAMQFLRIKLIFLKKLYH